MSCFLAMAVAVQAQSLLSWAHSFGGTGNDRGIEVAITPDQRFLYLVGNYAGPADMDDGPGLDTLSRRNSCFFSKYTVTGTRLWSKEIGGIYGGAHSVAALADGGFAIVGEAGIGNDFDPGPGTFTLNYGTTYPYGGFVARYDSLGNFMWARAYKAHASGADFVSMFVAEAPNGDIITMAQFDGGFEVNPPTPALVNSVGIGNDVCLIRHNSTGTFQHGYSWGIGNEADQLRSFAVDGSGNVYLVGGFKPYGPSFDLFVYKISPNGQKLWDYSMTTINEHEMATDLVILPSGNLLITGAFDGTVDFDESNGVSSLTSAGYFDVYFLEITPAGNFVGVSRMGGSGADEGLSLSQDSLGHIYVAASIQGTADIVPGPGVQNFTAVTTPLSYLILKYDNWVPQVVAEQPIGPVQHYGYLFCDDAGGIYRAGMFSGVRNVADLPYNYPLISSGGSDGFVAKYQTCVPPAAPQILTPTQALTICAGQSVTLSAAGAGTLGWYTASAGGSYVSGGSTLTTPALSVTTTYYVQDSLNCRSPRRAVTVTVLPPSQATLVVQACSTYTLNGQTYTSSGSYTQHLTSSQGCDSALTLNLTIGSSTNGSLTTAACNSYTLNGQTYASSGTYVQQLTNVLGCDSTLTLNLTIRSSTNGSLTASACNSYTLNGQTYASSGTYVQQLTNVQGCDSTLTLNLTIHYNSTHVINANVCDQYTLNGQTYTSSGTYTQHLTNALGCDSIITIILNVTQVTTGVTVSGGTLTAQASGAQYQWIHCDSAAVPGANGQSFTPTISGNYAVIVTQNACSDTSACHAVIVNGVALPLPRPQLWPNPSSGWVNLDFGQWIEGEVTVLNALGQVVGAAALTDGRAQVALPVASGVYWVQVLDRDGRRGMWQVLRL